MGPFIGFLVLLGPLVFVVLWLPLCLWIARKVAKRFTSASARWASGVAAFFVMFLLPFADSIAGRIYLNHLCSTEAGVKVYQTVELPAEYWDEKGAVKFPLVRDNYISSYKENRYSRFFQIDKAVYSLNGKSGKVLVEDVVFLDWGGWVMRTFSPHNTAISCGTGSMNIVFKRINQK